jgi:hypothetical protein
MHSHILNHQDGPKRGSFSLGLFTYPIILKILSSKTKYEIDFAISINDYSNQPSIHQDGTMARNQEKKLLSGESLFDDLINPG